MSKKLFCSQDGMGLLHLYNLFLNPVEELNLLVVLNVGPRPVLLLEGNELADPARQVDQGVAKVAAVQGLVGSVESADRQIEKFISKEKNLDQVHRELDKPATIKLSLIFKTCDVS